MKPMMTVMLLWMGLSACAERPEPPPPVQAPPTAPPAVPAPSAVPDDTPTAETAVTRLVLATVGDQMRFDQARLEAPAGSIAISLTNNASTASMLHNVVVVRAGTVDVVGPAAIAAGEERGYVPDSPDVLAATPLLGPGQTGALVVTLEPGEYEYICTFPGHYLQMRGTLRVTAR